MTVIGHQAQQRQFMDAWHSGRIHHAWLLAGPMGIGKARFARESAAYVLAGGGPVLDIGADHPTRKLMDAGSHSDFRILERLENKDGKRAGIISVEQVRALQALFQGTPALGAWRAVIVDSIDDMNRNAANALLKNLEEPPANTLFMLVSHAPDRLLPTIRSRCRLLRFQPLSESEVARVVAIEGDEVDPAEVDALSTLAAGSPGRALRLAGLQVRDLLTSFDQLMAATPAECDRLALALGRNLAGKGGQGRYEAFLELLPDHMAQAIRNLRGETLAEGLALWEKAHELSRGALTLSLDPQTIVFELASLLGALGRRMKKTG